MLEGKTAMITGCNRGIGRAIFEKFISHNANIVCCVRKIDNNLLEFVDSVQCKSKIKLIEFDLSDEDQINEAIKKLIKEKIKLDILVNNAAVASGAITEMTSTKQLKKTFQINFFSQIKIIQLSLRLLKKNENSSIINIGSISGLVGKKGTLAYGSSKAALMFATKVMAKEFDNYKIRVNTIAPSVVKTEMLNKMDKKALEDFLKISNLKEPLNVDKIAEKVLYLASEESKHVNGEILRIEGKN